MAIFIFIIVVCGFAGLAFLFLRKLHRRVLFASLNRTLFLVRLPRRAKEGKDVKSEINLSEQFLGSLTSFKTPVVFEVAVPYVGEEIHFYVSVDSRFSEPMLRQIQSVWNDALVERSDDYNIFNYAGVSVGGYVVEKDKFALPIRTYEEANADTFMPILGGLAKINDVGEGGAIQYVVRSAPSTRKKSIKETLKALKKGKSLKSASAGTEGITFSDVRKAFEGDSNNQKKDREVVIDEALVKAIESKLSKPLFEVNVRVLASAPSQYQAEAIFDGVVAGFSQFSAPDRNEFKIIKPKNNQKLFQEFSFRTFSKEEAIVLNSGELSSIFHFPNAFTEVPRIKHAKTHEAPPPSNLPDSGVLIGRSVYRGEARDVRVSDEDRRRHIYVVGQTGTGKSNLLTTMVKDDILQGKGVAIIDPHGDLTLDILGLVPASRKDDVIVFDPSDLERPLGLNMIEYDLNRPEEKTFIVNEMQSIFNKLFSQETMGPMFEQYMRNALLLLMEDAPNEPATLMEVPRVFTDGAFRARKLARIKNPAVIDFWEKEAVKAGGEAALQNMTPYITSKFNNFNANDYMRIIIGQPKSAFRFRDAMDQGKILLINLSKGKIGDINANLLGMIIVGKILMAALSRVDVPQENRRDFNLYIDEFQNFTTDSIAVILSEARKYRLNLTIAHQFIAQLSEKIRDAVFGNVGSLIAFRIGSQDAEVLSKQLAPVFTEDDLINLDNFNACVRLLISGETSVPFNIKTIRSEPGDRNVATALRNASRSKYGEDREKIETEILKRLRD